MRTQELKKHVGAIHVSGKLSLLSRKIANILLLNAYDKLLCGESHTISMKDLGELAGYNSNDDATLKESFRQLAKTTVEWNVLDPEGSEDWTVATLLSRATIKRGKGVCEYAYDQELSKKLYHPAMYASINLTIQKKFSSGYALVLYENSTRFKKIGTTGWIKLEDWRKLFGVRKEQYQMFKDFSKRVLKPAIKEVNNYSDIRVHPEYRRVSRKITAIKFSIDTAPVNMVKPLNENNDVSPLLERMLALGVTHSIADKILLEHPIDKVDRNIAYAEKKINAGFKLKNIGGYVVKAIIDDYSSATNDYEKKIVEQKKEIEKSALKEVRKRRLMESEDKLRQETLKQEYANLPTTQQEKLIDQALSELDPDGMIAREYRKKGEKSILFRGCVMMKFKEFLIKTT